MWPAIRLEILERLFPEDERSTPTCSASVESGRGLPFMVMGETSCQYATETSPLGVKESSLVFSFTFNMQREEVRDWEMFRRDCRA